MTLASLTPPCEYTEQTSQKFKAYSLLQNAIILQKSEKARGFLYLEIHLSDELFGYPFEDTIKKSII